MGHKGLLVLAAATREVLASFSLVEMYRWGYRADGNFYVELKRTVSRPGPATALASATRGPMYQYITREGRAVSDHLTAYALQLVAEIKAKQHTKAKGAIAPAAPSAGSAAAGGGSGSGRSTSGEHAADLGLALRLSGSSAALERSAAIVQSVFRGYKLRSKLINNAAAVRIQALWRGCAGRARFDRLLEAEEAALIAASRGGGT